MDEVEMKQRIEKIKHDPLFPQYQQWLRTEIFDLPPEEQLPEFGEHDEDEELVSFLLWLERPSSKPSLENSMPDPNPAETAAVAVAEPKAVAPGPVTPGPETHEPQSKKVTFSPEVMVHKSPAVDNLAVNTASTAAPAAPTAPALCPASSAVTTIPLAAEHSPPASILKAPEAKAAPPAPVSTASNHERQHHLQAHPLHQHQLAAIHLQQPQHRLQQQHRQPLLPLIPLLWCQLEHLPARSRFMHQFLNWIKNQKFFHDSFFFKKKVYPGTSPLLRLVWK